MPEHESQFEVEPDLLRQMKAAPFPYHLLRDRDFFGMQPVDESDQPALWRMPRGGALVRVWHDGYWAKRTEVLTDKAALKVWQKVGLHLPAERKAAIDAAFTGRPTLADALTGAFGPGRLGLYPLEETVARRLYLIDHRQPKRDALLEVHLENDRVTGHAIVEGKPAWTRLRKHMRR